MDETALHETALRLEAMKLAADIARGEMMPAEQVLDLAKRILAFLEAKET